MEDSLSPAGGGVHLDASLASALLLDCLRRLATDGSPAMIPPALELFALANPSWLGERLLLVAWAAVWCERPAAVEGLLYAHAAQLKGACAARWAVRSTAPPAGVGEPLAVTVRRAALLDGLERAYVSQRPGSAAAAGSAHADRRAAALQAHDRFWGALAAAPTKLRALAPTAGPERDALARGLIGAAAAAASLPTQLVLPTRLRSRLPTIVVRAPLECVRALATAERCPLLLVLETLDVEAGAVRADGTAELPAALLSLPPPPPPPPQAQAQEAQQQAQAQQEHEPQQEQRAASEPAGRPPAQPPATDRRPRARLVRLSLEPAGGRQLRVRVRSVSVGAEAAPPTRAQPAARRAAARAPLDALDVTARSWAEVADLVCGSSPFGSAPGWGVCGLLLKADAPMAVEQFAQALLAEAQAAFLAERAPLRLWPYEVRALSARAGAIELIPDAPSLHELRVRLGSACLSDHFRAAYGERGCAAHAAALSSFGSSLAAYAVVCYALQIKDRHNGNILLHASGSLIHVDFGFLLGDAPGGGLLPSVETAPFKLTREWLELLSGGDADAPELRRFRSLCAVGMLALRRHANRLLGVIEAAGALARRGGPAAAALLPCLRGGDESVARGVRERLLLDADDDAACAAAEALVDASIDAWGTWAYDTYQRAMHGIE